MGSMYEPDWIKCLANHGIRASLDDLRQQEGEDLCIKVDVPAVRRRGERTVKSWNVRIKINRNEQVSGNAAHLNCLGKMLQKNLRPNEHLWLETEADGEENLKLLIYFEKTSDEDVSA